MKLCDTHSHLSATAYDEDRENILRECFASDGLAWVIDVGTELVSSTKAVAHASRWPNLRATVGVHPHDARNYDNDQSLGEVLALAEASEVVALGEMGLDYHYDYSERSVQRRVFEKQLLAAIERDLPVVVHVREASEDALTILATTAGDPRFRGVWHCFSENTEIALRALEMGLHISFTGILTFPRSEMIREAASVVPLDRVMVETDSPYLSPKSHRGKRNHPLWVAEIAQKLAEIHQVSFEDIAQVTTENACRLFGLEKQQEGVLE